MSEANLDGNGYWYPLKNHDDDNDPLVPPTPNQSPHNSFRFKGPRGPGEAATEQGVSYNNNSVILQLACEAVRAYRVIFQSPLRRKILMIDRSDRWMVLLYSRFSCDIIIFQNYK